jgi:tyrosinase
MANLFQEGKGSIHIGCQSQSPKLPPWLLSLTPLQCLAKKPHSKLLKPSYPRANLPSVTADSSFYDDMTYIHMDLTDKIHYTGFFLPWHRWYLNQHITQLKQQCGYKGVMPYWGKP